MSQESRHGKGNHRADRAIAWIGTGQLTSRTSATGISHSSGSHGAKKQYNHRTEIVRLPSGSIVSIGPFETLDPSQASFNRPFVFAFRVSLMLWGLIGVAVWLLISAIR